MEPRIATLSEKKLIGKSLVMSLANNRTFELWRSFMSVRKEIKSSVSTDLFSMQVYPAAYSFKNFDATAEFEKCATVEVTDFNEVPADMKTYTLKGGLYAVFIHIGPASEAERTFKYIFTTWLPNSRYDLDQREHFEILGAKYKNNNPDSEEEIWIPIKTRQQ